MSISSTTSFGRFLGERFVFRGTGREYFGIWIVNILLTIVTLGIYSAWAKVRRMRYFLGNTYVLGTSFQYHATGKQILIGRLIVVGVLVVAQILSSLHWGLSLGISLLFLLALPWLIVKGLRFSAHVISYRNIRFNFTGRAGGAFLAFVVGGLIVILSLGILAPVTSRWTSRYLINHLRYGDRPFKTEISYGPLYAAWFVPAVIIVFGGVLASMGIYAVVEYGNHSTDGEHLDVAAVLGSMTPFFVVLLFTVATTYYRAAVRNAVLSATLIDGKHALKSNVSPWGYTWLVFSNLVLTILSLGLLRPWAAVREHRYLTQSTGIVVDGDISDVASDISNSAGSAFSAEYLDIEGFEFGL